MLPPASPASPILPQKSGPHASVAATQLLQNTTLGAFTVGADGRILAYNESATALWGRAPSESPVFYQHIFRCFAWNGRELSPNETPMARALAGIAAAEEETFIAERPDGSRRVWLMRAQPLPASQEARAVVFFREKALAAAPILLSEEPLPSLIAYVGNELRFRFANAGFALWFGLDEAEVVGRPLEKVLGPQSYAEIAPEIFLALAGSRQDFERFIPTGPAGSRFLLVRLVPDIAPGGFVRGIALIGSDISAERRAELAQEALQRQARLGPAPEAKVWPAVSGPYAHYKLG